MNKKWSYDGSMGIWEEVNTPQKKILVLRLGDGLGYNTDSIGHLAAAAPELLRALENADKLITFLLPGIKYIVLQDYGFLNNTLLDNRTAIAKAKGEHQP